MPAPHSFWVILIGKTPTSFRAKVREDLLPTLRQLQRTQTDVTLRWFERGKVWESPEAAIGAAKLAETEAREKRTKEWRPGGEHRDPKARFEMTRDQKRAKFKREQSDGGRASESPFGPKPPRVERPRPDRPPSDRSKPEGRPTRPAFNRARPDRPKSDRPWPDRPKSDRPWSDRSKSDRPGPGPRPDRPLPDRGPRPPRSDNRGGEGWSRPPSGDRPFGDRPPRRDRPSGPPMENPFKDRPRSDRRPDSGRPGRPPSSRGGDKPPRRRS
jgi:hypothetical protein